MKDGSQWINRFAFCDSALGQGAGAEEEWDRSHCRSAGRPSAVERIGNRYSGGLNGNEEIKIRLGGQTP